MYNATSAGGKRMYMTKNEFANIAKDAEEIHASIIKLYSVFHGNCILYFMAIARASNADP